MIPTPEQIIEATAECPTLQFDMDPAHSETDIDALTEFVEAIDRIRLRDAKSRRRQPEVSPTPPVVHHRRGQPDIERPHP